jgi:hypothetical protein
MSSGTGQRRAAGPGRRRRGRTDLGPAGGVHATAAGEPEHQPHHAGVHDRPGRPPVLGGPAVANPKQTTQVAANTGGGFLLGLFGWAVGLAYLRGGSDEVRKLLAAKFLNKTS